MKYISERPTDSIEDIMYTYGNMLFRLCIIRLGNSSDAQDVIQETFIQYIRKKPIFNDEEHKKAWLIKVAMNKCNDMLRYKTSHQTIDIEDFLGYTQEKIDTGIIDALMSIPDKFRLVLMLYYIEDNSIEEIARIIHKTKSAVKMRLQKGRNLLKETYRKEYM